MTTTVKDPRVASVPYPWPFAGELTGQRLALIVVGAQPWFVDRCRAADAALSSILRSAAVGRALGARIIWTVHARNGRFTRPGPPPSLPVAGSPEARLVREPAPDDLVVSAEGLDGFYGGPLDSVLRHDGRSLLVLTGIGLETTVHCTLRSANDRGYECLTLIDAVAGTNPSIVSSALSSICMSGGVFGAVADSRDLGNALRSVQANESKWESTCHSPQ